MAKAILLLSGGLDSTLAGKILVEMGVEVEAINFTSPFCTCTPKSHGCSAAKLAADQIGIPVRVFATDADYLETMKHPRFGRGKGVNACLDCRIYIFKRAKAYMEERGADCIATGEVLGERPMSQRRDALETIERESGLQGLIVRPLSALHFPPTIPEQKGLIDRQKLMAISGRCRKPQIELAKKMGLKDFLCPAGGCLLTEPDFAERFRDMERNEPAFGVADAKLLRRGRHFRLPSGAKVVLGRNAEENRAIENLAGEQDAYLIPVSAPGPTALCHRCGADDLTVAAQLAATYMKPGAPVTVELHAGPQHVVVRTLEGIGPLERAQVAAWRVAGSD